jgi:outer membrane protein assembly factor BamB
MAGWATAAVFAVAFLAALPVLNPIGAAGVRIGSAPAPGRSGRPFLTGTAVPSWPMSTGPDFPTYLSSDNRSDNENGSGSILNSSNAAGLQRLWHYSAGGTIATQVVESGGLVYFGSWDGYEYALYATNGTLRWKAFLGQVSGGGVSVCGDYNLGVTSTGTISNGTLYVNGGTPTLFALNASTGQQSWNLSIGGPGSAGFYLWSSPLLFGNDLFDGISSQCDDPLVPSGLEEVSTNGSEVGYFNSSTPDPNGSSIWATPSINGSSDTVFVTTGNPYRKMSSTYGESIVALNASTLNVTQAWAVPSAQRVADSDFGGTPTLFTPPGSPSMVAAVNKNGNLYAWYQSNLSLRWDDFVSNQTSITTPAYGGGLLYVYSPATVINGTIFNSSVRGIDPVTGAYVWQVGLPKHYIGYSAPLYYDGLLFVSDNCELLVLNASTGSVVKLFTWNLGGQILSSPAIARNEVYVAAGATVTALDLPLTAYVRASVNGSQFNVSLQPAVQGGLPPYSYSWTFGDGNTSSAADATHTYAGPGFYQVRLNVTDLAGVSATYSTSVQLGAATYRAIFSETGLPVGSTWAVTVGGINISGVGALSVRLTNGTYSYQVSPIANYSARMTGAVTIAGTGESLVVRFSEVKYTVTFREVGLPSLTSWDIGIQGRNVSTNRTFENFRLPNGTYGYYVGTVANYSRVSSGTVTIAGSGLVFTVHFALVKYTVSFKETGLTAGTSWNVTVRSLTHGSTTGAVKFWLANGTYSYFAGPGVNESHEETGNLTVNGSTVALILDFTVEIPHACEGAVRAMFGAPPFLPSLIAPVQRQLRHEFE